MDSSLEQHLVITKAIVELTAPSGSLGLAKSRWKRNNMFEDSEIVFHDYDWHDLPSHHNLLLYVRTSYS